MAENLNSLELSVIIPCFNEEKNVSNITSKISALLSKNGIIAEIVLVNDASTDGTAGEIERLSGSFSNIRGVNHHKNFGIVEAWYSGLAASRGKYVVTIDADLQYAPEDIMILYDVMAKGGYDLVQGWRKDYKDTDYFRKFLSRGLSLMLNLIFFTKINDIKSGFVIYKRQVFFDILKSRGKFRAFQHFFILCALKKGYKFKQVPVVFHPRSEGKSFIKNPLFFSLRVLSDIPKAIFYYGPLAGRKNRE